MPEPADINVDELRRRARRRLVGAIVLALAAAVIVPMLLESDPKPLGEDVSIKIPPVDDSKFVNRLSDAAPSSGAAAPGDATPEKSIADAERAVIAPASKAPKYDTRIAPDKASDAAPSPSPSSASAAPGAPVAASRSETGAQSRAEPKSEPKSDQKSEWKAASTSKPDAKPSAPAASPKAETARDGFAVQLAAFSDDRGANALANRLKSAGYPAYTEAYNTSRGTLWRVRVGPYASRDAAGGVRDKLKSEGQSGIVAPAH
jgi:DedD protein